MVQHAWLDSLTEDWVSEGSSSDVSEPQLPALPLRKKLDSPPRSSPGLQSRIPRRPRATSSKPPSSHSPTHDSSANILGERNANDLNIARPQFDNQLSQEEKASGSRVLNLSDGSYGSVVHHAVQHQYRAAANLSATPEWKRRIVYGEVQYGEHVDLFCSAKTGLQDMFKPPQPGGVGEDVDQTDSPFDTTMPSSPPIPRNVPTNDELDDIFDLDEDEEYREDEDDDDADENNNNDDGNDADADAEYPDQDTPSPSPRRPQREVRYKLNAGGSSHGSLMGNLGLRRISIFDRKNAAIFRGFGSLRVPNESNHTSRKTSGGDTRNEHFSPIYLEKHNHEDGNMDFTPMEMSADELHRRLERLRLSQMVHAEPQSPTSAEYEPGPRIPRLSMSGESLYEGNSSGVMPEEQPEQPLPRQKPLNPELVVDSSEIFPEESLQASTPKQFPTVKSERLNQFRVDVSHDSPLHLRAPHPSPEKKQVPKPATEQSGSSPLKLFGPYDTFTNKTLLHRISQFEEALSGSEESTQSSIKITPDEPEAEGGHSLIVTVSRQRAISQFGGGDLEGFKFSGGVPHTAHDEPESPGKENISPRSPTSLGFVALPDHVPLVDNSELQDRRRRRKPTFISGLKRIDLSPLYQDSYAGGIPRRDHSSDKRPRTSPSKDSTPKRRRTLHKSDIAFGNDVRLADFGSSHAPIQLLMAKRGGEASRLAPFFVDGRNLSRKSTRPQPLPPRQGSMLLLDEEQSSAMQDSNADNDDSEKSLGQIIHGDDDEEDGGEQPFEGTRKPSIRTQDFVNQAAQIMAMIRNQVGQPSLASLVESEGESGLAGQAEASQVLPDDSSEDEPLSRPPSREGKFVSWLPTRQEDPELLDRLKKYQELSDMGDIISSSVRSVNLAKDAIRAAQEIEKMIEETGRRGSDERFTKIGRVISGLVNIPVANSSTSIHEPGSPVNELHSDSSNRLSSHTFPSGSSRGSESRRIIMPESVSHLIPDNVAGMYLDKQNNIWVKKKERRPSSAYVISFDDSDDDDPFANIPDLTVDMTKEMEQLKPKGLGEDSDGSDCLFDTSFEGPSFGQLHEDCTHQARDSGMAARAVDELKKLDPSGGRFENFKNGRGQQLGSQDHGPRFPAWSTRRRNLTISFSSPIASIIQDMRPEDLDSLDDDPDTNEPVGDVTRAAQSPPSPPLPSTLPSDSRNLSRLPIRSRNPRGPNPKRRAAARRSFIPRPVSRIDEQDEEDTVEVSADNGQENQLSIIKDRSLLDPNPHDASLTVFLNRTPAGQSLARQNDDSLLIGQNVGRLSLTPLSEFTIHQPDQSFGFEVSYVMGQRHMATGNGSKRVLSMTIRDLVDKLAEVEPFEPYWEDMTALDLHNKQLTSLHMLDEFCGKVTVLNASENALAHLEGVPPRVRQLKVSHNMLTELTSWDHLLNLQYVDISGNEIKSLSALRSLVHLRSLRADDNRLTSLDGLDSHDGLLSLRARHNLIEELHAEDLKFERLTELDLESNQITTVTGIESLPSLAQLNLSDNRLASLTFHKTVRSLRSLSANDNEITSMDIRNLPNLQTLHLDRNQIQELSGLRHVRRIDSLSLREQRTDAPLDLGFLSSACEVRKLFLSGNFLKTFKPRSDFLNLQLLEIANCGLSSLPADLGQMMPNLRALNLNFNALSDLTPLRFIPRLKKLFVAGNRLVDSTLVTELLTDFPHLTELDMRDNPITQGFYPPLQVLVSVGKPGSVDRYSLPESDQERDAWFCRLLDEPTKLRRRLHEVVFVASCKRLRKLDGLAVSRGDVLARDCLLQTLIDEGLVPELEDTLVAESEMASASASASKYKPEFTEQAEAVAETEEPQSSRWNAEDSFA